MEITGGSLGQGLGIAAGARLGLKRKGSPCFVYNLLSDGELNEGSTWDAVGSAAHWKLNNLIAFLDAGALPTLHDRYGISTQEVCARIKAWL